MKAVQIRFVVILVASIAAVFLSKVTNADLVYVWSNDGTIRRIDPGGIASLVTSNDVASWNGPVGLTLDNVGNLYAGVPSNSSIFRFSPDGTRSSLGLTDSVSGLAFDGAGQLYMTSPNFSALGKLTWVSPGYYTIDASSKSLTGSNPAVNLCFDSVGQIYLASSPLPWMPFQITDTTTIEKYSSNLTHVGTFATNLNNPWGLAFDKSESLYVSNSGTNGALSNTIVRFNKQGVLSVFADANSGLSSPRGLAFDGAGNLYVANYGSGSILKFGPDGVSSVFTPGLNSPTSIAIFPGLGVWSATPIKLMNPKIQPNGAFESEFIDNAGLTFKAMATTNLSSTLTGSMALSGVVESPPGIYRFTDPYATNGGQRFYRVFAP